MSEEEKEAKLKEKEQLNLLMSATTFFTKIYSFLSLELDSSVEKIHLQTVTKPNSDKKEIVVFYENKAFPFCRCYVKFTENFFTGNIFADWIMKNNKSFSIPIETVNIIRKMKKTAGKNESYVPLKVDFDDDKFVLKYRHYRTKIDYSEETEAHYESKTSSDETIRFVKGTTDYWERLRQYVEKPFIKKIHSTPWLFDDEICNIYLDNNFSLVKEKTDKKILEISSKDIYVKIKDGEERNISYQCGLTDLTDKGYRWILITGEALNGDLVVGQVMRVITK